MVDLPMTMKRLLASPKQPDYSAYLFCLKGRKRIYQFPFTLRAQVVTSYRKWLRTQMNP